MERNRIKCAHAVCQITLAVAIMVLFVASQAISGPLGYGRSGSTSSTRPSVTQSSPSTGGGSSYRPSGGRSSGTTYSPGNRGTTSSTPRSGSSFGRSRENSGSTWSGRRPTTSTPKTTGPASGYSREYRPDRSGSSIGTRQPDSRTDRSRVFTRVGERERKQTRYYGSSYDHYYRSGYYRPYSGWKSPYRYQNRYYYSWPYTIEPYNYGYYIWNYDPAYAYRSAYFYYGYLPYIYQTQVVVDSPAVLYTERRVTDDYNYDDYYLTRPPGSIGLALDDVKRAWVDDQPGLLLNHIRSDRRIAVYLDGKYSYSINTDDYIAMTRDAFEKIETVSFNFTGVRERSSGDYIAYGKHNYYGVEDDIKTVYISYTFHKEGDRWFITEVGSSDRPLGN